MAAFYFVDGCTAVFSTYLSLIRYAWPTSTMYSMLFPAPLSLPARAPKASRLGLHLIPAKREKAACPIISCGVISKNTLLLAVEIFPIRHFKISAAAIA